MSTLSRLTLPTLTSNSKYEIVSLSLNPWALIPRVVGSNPPVADRSPSDDWCVGYNPSERVAATEVQDSDPPRNEVLPTRDTTHHGDPYWVPPVYSSHEDRNLLQKWAVTSLH
ncbi:hypothetical protein HAX54_012002 [Datura stramonium]|uniref:Uncharacterized protein n=1 Tax=Datura stramonium TaxID=4076 RepID=A0ABS8TKS7_DATST|nr:hypothetical protein [Datura stramonium]